MSEEKIKENNEEKLGINNDDLSIDRLIENTRKASKKVMPKKRVYGYPRLKMIKGRPYYYLVWYEIDDKGFRRQKSIYLGNILPKGYRLGKRVKIASDKIGPC